MARSARRYDLFLPLTFNNGQPIPNELLEAIEHRLVTRFRGLTSLKTDFPLKGIWQGHTRIFLDQIIVLTALDFRRRGTGSFMAELKTFLLQALDQEEILLTETTLRVH